MAKQFAIKIDVVSDTVCPWCFIGKRRLEKAMSRFTATHPDVSFNIEWHPYQLSPNLPRHEARSVREHYAKKFGEERMQSMIPYMQDIGKQEGIKFTYNGLISNTVDSHRLALWAKQFGRQSEVVEEMFKDYFSNDKNIGDYEVLASAAERAGLDKNKALDYLKSEADVDTITKEASSWPSQGITGVPHFIIEGKYNFPGAQEPETFIAFFESLNY